MNSLAIDFGLKRIGLAYTQNNIIFTLPQIKNDSTTLSQIQKIISNYNISQIYVGLSEGKIADKTKEFVSNLKKYITLPFEFVEESISTIEAHSIYNQLKLSKKETKQRLDSFSAAVILGRGIGYN